MSITLSLVTVRLHSVMTVFVMCCCLVVEVLGGAVQVAGLVGAVALAVFFR
jgi:hypothetical protein